MCASYSTIKTEFENQLNQLLGVRKERTLLMTDARYNELVLETKEAIERRRYGLELSGLHYRRLKRFDIMTIDDCDKLVQRNENGHRLEKTIQFCRASEMFDVIHRAHLKIGHKKEKGMELELKKMYCNITREVIAIYLKLCQTCAVKRRCKEKSMNSKRSTLPLDLNSCCQIDIIDMKVDTDQGYRFILNYQDHQTKFLILRPLKTYTPDEVADNLSDIFSLIGVPNVFLCSNEQEFGEKVLQNLSTNWNINLVRGELKENNIHRISDDVFRNVSCWICENKSNNWVDSLRILQSLKNRCFNTSIKRTPFEALFGNRQSNSLLGKNFIQFEWKTEDKIRLQKEDIRKKLNEVTEIIKTQEEALHESTCDNKESLRCLNCDKTLISEVYCWKCNGPLHFNCALTNDNSENSFCQVCASKTAVHVLRGKRKRKLEEFKEDEMSSLQQSCPLFYVENFIES